MYSNALEMKDCREQLLWDKHSMIFLKTNHKTNKKNKKKVSALKYFSPLDFHNMRFTKILFLQLEGNIYSVVMAVMIIKQLSDIGYLI